MCAAADSFVRWTIFRHHLAWAMSSSSLPILYVKTGCPWCTEATTFLNANGIKYQLLDVTQDATARAEMLRKSGQTKAPTLDWHGKVLADFGVDELKPFLERLRVTLVKA
jgi:glutaredoxin 3